MTSRDPFLRLPSWLIAASLVVLVVATLTYFITSNNDNTDEAAPPATASTETGDSSEPDDSTPSSDDAEKPPPDEPSKDAKSEKPSDEDKAAEKPSEKPEPNKKPEKQRPDKPETAPSATVDVYNNSGITNLAASVSSDVQAVGFTVGGVDNWYGSIPESTVYYPSGMEEQARVLADDLGVSRLMPAISPMSTERLSLILTAAI